MNNRVRKIQKESEDDFSWVEDALNQPVSLNGNQIQLGMRVIVDGDEVDGTDNDYVLNSFHREHGQVIAIRPFNGNDVLLIKFDNWVQEDDENIVRGSTPLWNGFEETCKHNNCWSFMRDLRAFGENKFIKIYLDDNHLNESEEDFEWVYDSLSTNEWVLADPKQLTVGTEVMVDGYEYMNEFDNVYGKIVDSTYTSYQYEIILISFVNWDGGDSRYRNFYKNYKDEDCMNDNCWSFLKYYNVKGENGVGYSYTEGEDIKIYVKNPLYHKEQMTESVTRKKINMVLPKSVQQMNHIFKANGYELYVVGGAVRDLLLGQEPKDFDLATNATPDVVKSMLKMYRTIEMGEQFGIVNVVTPDGQYEIATFRLDKGKGRRPDSVEFTTIDQDVMRRDLTINALFYDIDKGEVVDLVGGMDDIENNVVRTVGSASERFDEDKLRVLRAVRFASRVGSELDKDIVDAVTKDKTPVSGNGLPLSQERIRDEFLKGIKQTQSVGYFTQMIDRLNLWDWLFGRLVVTTDPLIETRNPIVLIATLLRSNDPKLVEKTLVDSLKYTSEEAKKVSLLIQFLNTNSSDLYKLREKYDSIRMDEDTLRLFGEMNKVNPKALESFINYRITTSGYDLMKQGFKGREIGIEKDRIEREKFNKIMKEDVRKVSYTAVVLTDESRTRLIKALNIPEGWEVLAHHMTINLGPIKEMYKPLLGQSIDLVVTHVGELDNVMAVKVETELVTKNKDPHITIAVDRNNGGKPMLSNNVTEWITLWPFEVEGIVEEVYL